MKKLVLTIVCALAMTGAAFAQGTVNWGVISPAAMTVQTNSTQISPLFGGAANVGAVGYTALAPGVLLRIAVYVIQRHSSDDSESFIIDDME